MKHALDARGGRAVGRGPLSPDPSALLEWSRFSVVGITGIVVNQVTLVAVTELLAVHYLVSAALATLASSTWNFALIEWWAFGSRRPGTGVRDRYAGFLGLNVALLVLRIPLLWLLTEPVQVSYALSNLITLVAFFAIRLAVSHRWLWGGEHGATWQADPSPAATDTRARENAARYSYDVSGIVGIESAVALRELTYFRTDRIARPGICISVGLVAPRPTRRVMFEESDGELVYREHLGPLAANFSIRMGDPIEIKVSPVLAISPHVVYTNIVEALLRFLLVSKGYVLLHSAAIADEHGSTLLSAQTDTGKTSTVITLVRNGGYRFLSDDMTIIGPGGEAISYPKPMTLSFHTMRVAKDGRLTASDRMALAIQSRLHSRSGRRMGQALGTYNLPIMTMNAIVQALVPPPKHRIDALFECTVGGRAQIRDIVLMERGEEREDRLSVDDTVGRLIENTDDAYGFPPFSLFAPHIRIDGADYQALRARESELLGAAIATARTWYLQVPGHEWAERLPGIINRPLLVPVGPGTEAQLPPPVPVAMAVERPFVPEVIVGDGLHELVSVASEGAAD